MIGPSRSASAIGAVALDRRRRAASCASHGPSPQTISTAPPGARVTASTKSCRPAAAPTSVTPFAANLASVSAVTMPAPNCVGPHGPQHSAFTSTWPRHWSRSWQQSRFISSLAVA